MRPDHADQGVLSTTFSWPSERRRPHTGVSGDAVPVREGLFTDTDPPRLLGSRCAVCGRHHFPRQDTCPYCTADGASPVELSGTGRLWSWTTVTTAPPGYRGEVPYGFGVVELPEGLRVVTRLTETDPARLSAGQPMALGGRAGARRRRRARRSSPTPSPPGAGR